jgi:AraC-like DNA-binding protein
MATPRIARPATFERSGNRLHADTCEPLKAAVKAGTVRVVAWGRGSYPGRRFRAQELPEVSSIGYWDARHDQAWGLDWHCNEGIELTLLTAGSLPFQVDRQSFNLAPGDVTITRPWQRHRVGRPHTPASRLIWLILDVGVRRPNQAWSWPKWVLLPKQRLDRLTTQLRHNEEPVWRANPELSRAFAAIAGAVSGTPSAGTRLKLAINEVLLSLADLLDHRRPRLDARLSSSEHAVRVFLNELRVRVDEPWTLETMAAHCGVGRTTFGRLCHQLTNRTPIEHLAACRVDYASRRLVEQPQQSITEVALASGFQSSQYFATVFARHTGASPGVWRQRHGGGDFSPPAA